MRARVQFWRVAALGFALTCAAWVASANAQQHVILDKPFHAGELTLFPSLDDPKVYYYLPDKIRMATDENGNPDFSFIRYVQNVRSGADQSEAREGQGGGIVHASVMMSVSKEQLAAALRELQGQKAGARIEGPVSYKAGRFMLISAFADGKGANSTQVLGLGSAPILDGEKASVSIELTKDGSIKLWDSFNLANPSIDFKFEMDASGYSSPMSATIDGDWSKIYSHRAFGAGIASTYLAAEIKDALDELRTTDAIHITQVGGDEKMDQVVATAYQMIKDRMFEPLGGTGNPSLNDLTSMGQNQPSLLDRASERLKEAKAEVAAENADIRRENDAIRGRNEKVAGAAGRQVSARDRAEAADRAAVRAEAEAASLERRADFLASQAAAAKAELAAKAEAAKADAAAIKADQPAKSDLPDGAQVATATQRPPAPPDNAAEIASLRKQAEASKAEAARLRREADSQLAATDSLAAVSPEKEALKQEKDKPSISLIATLEMKKIKQSGTFHFDMNKYNPDNRTFPFTQGIGDLSRLKNDARYFRQINMDDPLFKQREIVAMVDGVNAQDFGQFVNFVSVQMRKKHEGGDVTDDEVRVDRSNFNKEGNNFKLMYGWKGDNDRSKWMEYEVQATWSMFGGKTVIDPWRKVTDGAIDLHPPYRRRTLTFDGSPETLTAADVRAVTVQVFYDVAGAEQSKQLTLNVAKGQVGDKVDILAEPNQSNYAYQLTWQLKGNKTVQTQRQTTVSDIVYVDDLPAH